MNVRFYEERLREMLNDFYTVTGLSFSVYSLEREVAYCNDTFPPYCTEIRRDSARRERCEALSRKALDQAMQTREAVTYCCHAGLCETVLPIVCGMVPVGYFVIGQYRDAEGVYATEQAMTDSCAAYGLDPAMMAEKRWASTAITLHQREAAVRMAQVIVDYLLSHRIITPVENDVEQALRDYVDDHLGEDLSVSRLCRASCLSRSALYRLFARLGISPHEYVVGRRMERASHLLRESERKPADIAAEVGFPDYNYFIRAFRRAFGVTPRQWRDRRLGGTPCG